MSKQREEFEAWYFNENYKNTTACKIKVFEILSGLVGVEASYNNTYLNYNVQHSWKAWQQAQKVAVPDGFVVVLKEMSDDLNDQLWDFMTDNFVRTNEDGDAFIECADFDLNMFYKAMIEAGEKND